AKIRHEVPERSRFPALIQRLQALGHAVSGRRDLIGVDRIELLLLAEDLQIPEDERLSIDRGPRARYIDAARGGGDRLTRATGLDPGGANRLPHPPVPSLLGIIRAPDAR